MVTLAPLTLGEDALSDVRAYLRIEQDEEDPLLLALIAAALRHAEGFAGQVLITRSATAQIKAAREWQRLPATPVRSINAVGSLAVGDFAIDIDANGDGWVRVDKPMGTGLIEVAFAAGLSIDWASLPEPIRLATIRLTAHLHALRDDPDDAGPPPAVAALLRPWRRMRLS